MWCWHKWEKWKKISDGVLLATGDSLLTGANYTPEQRYPVGHYERQRRECEKCGKSQMREAKSK